MSIVTTVLNRLAFAGAISTRVSSLASKLKLEGVSISSHQDRTWHSPAMSRAFNAQRSATKGYLEAQARFPISR